MAFLGYQKLAPGSEMPLPFFCGATTKSVEDDAGADSDLCKLPVHFSPSKMSIISTPQGLKTIKDLCIVKETKKVFEIHLQKLHFGEFQEIQLFGIQNR